MRYCIAIEVPEDETKAFGVVVPDIPGCFSAGDTLEEAIVNAKGAILIQLEDIIDRKETLPQPSSPHDLVEEYRNGDWILSIVDIDPAQLSKKAKRINITIPEGVLYEIDQAADKLKMNRSSFLVESAVNRISMMNYDQWDNSTVNSIGWSPSIARARGRHSMQDHYDEEAHRVLERMEEGKKKDEELSSKRDEE